MKFKKQRDEEERLERAAKIKSHLNRTQPAAAKADSKADQSAPKAAEPLIYSPLQPWEKIGVFGRPEQYRPMTSREFDQENDKLFMASQQRQEEAHAKKVAAAEQEQSVEQAAAKKRAEHETKTGKRPYEPGRYVSLDEARRRGLIGSGKDNEIRAEETRLRGWNNRVDPRRFDN
jgi:hypothetical protein